MSAVMAAPECDIADIERRTILLARDLDDWTDDAIHKRLDEEFVKFPDAAKDREALYHQLLEHFNEYGALPEFTLEKKS